MFVNIAPSMYDIEATFDSLRFAESTGRIKNQRGTLRKSKRNIYRVCEQSLKFNSDLVRIDVTSFASVTAQYTVAGGGATKGEVPGNLILPGEEPWNKWGYFSENESWIRIDFTQEFSFTGLGLKSANDVPTRDPTYALVSVIELGDT